MIPRKGSASTQLSITVTSFRSSASEVMCIINIASFINNNYVVTINVRFIISYSITLAVGEASTREEILDSRCSSISSSSGSKIMIDRIPHIVKGPYS